MNLLVFLFLLGLAPKLLFERLLKGKRHPGFLQRIGLRIPTADKPVIWIHAVSVGEVKAIQPLFRSLRQTHPHHFFLITTTTATGQAEAHRSLPEADAFAYLPIDLTWIVNRWVRQLNPTRFLLVESDFWLNLLSALKKNGTHIALVSGKMSERSARCYRKFLSFSKRLFSHFDLLCVQDETHFHRFLPLVPDPTRLRITGNLKLDLEPQPTTNSLDLPQPLITISCTHAPEEAQILDILRGYPCSLILAPRHPERFEEVAQLLTQRNIPFSRWSQPGPHHSLLLIDAMGQLPICYRSSRLAILGGSFVSHIGGHNILEPLLYGTPVFFGPHTFGQIELVSRTLEAGAGLSVPLSHLRAAVETFFDTPSQEQAMRTAALQLIQAGRGATLRTLKDLNDR